MILRPIFQRPLPEGLKELHDLALDYMSLYRAQVPADRPAGDFTPRTIPHRPEVSVPGEAVCILWYK
ncbi:MAG: hypothetical protein HPY61_12685 [Methanotrichaceae archaeon]|nr:hypothetical protein [Methanotrichaceae archaeon]